MPTKKSIKPLATPVTSKTKSKPTGPTSSTVKASVKRVVKASTPVTAKFASKGGPTSKVVPPPAALPSLRPGSKQSQLLERLGTGATMAQMMELTGWQAHTLRATLSAVFRKRLKLIIDAGPAAGDSTRIYRITGQTAA
jgi:hypothetical protein